MHDWVLRFNGFGPSHRCRLRLAFGFGRRDFPPCVLDHRIEGSWFNDGFAGAMGAVLQAIEDGTQPLNDARGNLDSLALVFAAIASAHRGVPVVPGTVTNLAAACR